MVRRLVLGTLLMTGLACSGNGSGNVGDAGRDIATASGGAFASGGSNGSAGGSASGGTFGTGGAATGGAGTGTGGSAPGGAGAGTGGTAGASTTGQGGAAGNGPTTGNGGASGLGTGGRVGPGGAGGRGDAAGASGSGGTAGIGGPGPGGTGGCGCVCAGTCVDTGGSSGTGGVGTGGTAGSGGSSNPLLHVTYAQPYPASQLALIGMLIDVDSQDRAVVIGPRASSDSADPGPAMQWIPRTGAPAKMEFASALTPKAMAVDASDNVWMAGPLYRSVTFGGPTADPVDQGYYLAKLGSTGTTLLTKAITTPDSTNLRSVTTDGAGNLYVVGSRRNLTMNLSRVFVTKYSASGTQVFDHEYPSTDSQAEATDVAIAPDGTVVITGFYVGQITFGTTKLTSLADLYNGFVAWLAPANGNPTRAQSFGGTIFDFANSIEVTAAGAIRIGGQLSGSSTVGGMTATADAKGAPFVAELTSTGAANWVRVISGAGIVFQGDTNAAGRTFEIGRIEGTTDDSFVAAVGSDGGVSQLLRTDTGMSGNGAVFAAADRHGGVWVAGEFAGTADFGTGPLIGAAPPATTNYLLHLEP